MIAATLIGLSISLLVALIVIGYHDKLIKTYRLPREKQPQQASSTPKNTKEAKSL